MPNAGTSENQRSRRGLALVPDTEAPDANLRVTDAVSERTRRSNEYLRSQYGPVSVVTDASSRVGSEFARQLAEAGLSLALVAKQRSKLEPLIRELQERFEASPEVVELDLLADTAIDQLLARTSQLDVGLVVLGASTITAGAFTTNELQAETELITLSAVRPMQLAHHYASRVVDRQRGGIILLTSAVGPQPAPYLANYAATKAYVSALGQALSYELHHSGVDVTVLSSGPIGDPRATPEDAIDLTRLPLLVTDPRDVVASALNGLGRSPLVIPRRANKLLDLGTRLFLPRPLRTRLVGWALRKALSPESRTHATSR